MNRNYIELANVTMSNQWHGGNIAKAELVEILGQAVSTLEDLDKIKKALFYGRAYAPLYFPNGEGLKDSSCHLTPQVVSAFGQDTDGIKLIHGIIGSATEAGEKLEALLNAISNNTEIDIVNLLEEIGDGFWYDAAVCRVAGTTFEAVQDTNIAKLQARFPDGFNSYHADNRKLDEERVILEHHVAPHGTMPVGVVKGRANVTQATLLPFGNAGRFTLVGMCANHPTGDGTLTCIRTSDVLYYDMPAGTVETKNTIYTVDSWA